MPRGRSHISIGGMACFGTKVGVTCWPVRETIKLPPNISHQSRSSSPVSKFAGTIPVIKQRPRVTRRPSIPGPATPQKQALKKKAEPKPAKLVALEVEAVAEKTPLAELAPVAEKKGEPKRDSVSKTVGPTMPEKKPLVTKQAKAAAEAAKPRQAKAAGQSRWAPLAVGIALGSLAPAIYALAALWDPWGLRVVFPFVQLVGLREFGISHELARMLPQLMLYLQFPLEGILVASNLRRGMKLSAALGAIPPLHFAGGLVLWIVALGSLPPV
jgi:hypothetical protein